MKQTLIILTLGLFILWGFTYWGFAAKVFIENQGSKATSQIPCTVISTRADAALDLNSHLSELSKPEFLKNYTALSQQPMARVEFPLLGTPSGVPMGRSPVQLAKAFIDSSFAKFIFPVTYRISGKDYLSNQEIYPVPIWLDPLPDFSKEITFAKYEPGHPEKAECSTLVEWQMRLLFLAGLITVVSSSVILLFYRASLTSGEGDKNIDKIYNERFKGNRLR